MSNEQIRVEFEKWLASYYGLSSTETLTASWVKNQDYYRSPADNVAYQAWKACHAKAHVEQGEINIKYSSAITQLTEDHEREVEHLKKINDNLIDIAKAQV